MSKSTATSTNESQAQTTTSTKTTTPSEPEAKGRGRPKKYTDEESRIQAKRQQEKESRARRKARLENEAQTDVPTINHKKRKAEKALPDDHPPPVASKHAKFLELRDRVDALKSEIKDIRNELQEYEPRSCCRIGCISDGVLECWLGCDVWFCPKHFMERSTINSHLQNDCDRWSCTGGENEEENEENEEEEEEAPKLST
jgi:hypothetical protein